MSLLLMLFNIFAEAEDVEPLTVDAGSNLFKSKNGFTECGNPGNTGTPGASVSGGAPPYTYLWEQIGTPAEAGPFNCSNVNILNPFWNKASVCNGDFPDTETWRLTVTDDDTTEADDSITVRLRWINIG